MIEAVETPRQKAAFDAIIAPVPHFRAVLGTDLALWVGNPGAPIRLYLASGAALALSGSRAQLCGTPQDWEELTSFLRFAGVERVLCSAPCKAGWLTDRLFHRYTLAAGSRLPLPPRPPLLEEVPLTLNRHPAMGPVAQLLFSDSPAQQDYFYTVACTAINHGFGCCLTLHQASPNHTLTDGLTGPENLHSGLQNALQMSTPANRVLTTVGCYERCHGEAYMAAGETVPELRGQGLGGWLIVTLANELAAEGWNVSFLCEYKRCHFYDRLGFTKAEIYSQYIMNETKQ